MKQTLLSAEDKKLIRQIQGDLPIFPTPFAPLAEKIGRPEGDLLRRVRGLLRQGVIRRFGAILRHQQAGYRGNAMVVWKVPEDQILRVSKTMASFASVSHCYLRSSLPHWPFNLYTMVHGCSEKDCHMTAWKISKKTGIKNYRLLFSRQEHKKSSMRYFEKG